MGKQIDDQDLIDKTLKDELTLGVTPVAVNDEWTPIRGVIWISASSALRDENLVSSFVRVSPSALGLYSKELD